MQINMKLLPMKAHYFLSNAGVAPLVPFLPTFIRQLGFSSVVVGNIYFFLPIAGMFAKPLSGALADKFQCQKLLFLIFIFITMVSFYGVNWIPPLTNQSKAEVHCDKDSVLKICSDRLAPSADPCLTYRLAQTWSLNGTVDCELTCTGDEAFIESVCTTWNQPQFCSSTAFKPPQNHLLEAAKKQTGTLSKDPHPVKKKLAIGAPQTLNFNSKIRPARAIIEHDCIFIPLSTVKFTGPDWHVAYCNNFTKSSCQVVCEDGLLNNLARQDIQEVTSAYQFWLLFVFLIVGWVGMAVTVSVGDAICFELLGDHPSLYGNQRLWGSVGWGIFSFFAGWLVDEFSSGSATKNYTPAFYVMVILLMMDIGVASRLKYKQSHRSPHVFRDVVRLLWDLKVVVFICWCIAVGFATALIWNFLFWHLENLAMKQGCDTQDWIKTLEGLVMGIQCFGGELPFFFLSGWILRKIGHVMSMTLVLATFGVRFLLYYLLTNPWWCLPIELLNGLTFGLFYSTMASYASIISPPGTETTMQGLVGAVFEGVGVSLGSFVAGHVMNIYGGSTMFLAAGLIAITLAVVHFVVQLFIEHRSVVLVVEDKVTAPLLTNTKDFNRTSYASPCDAIHMLEDRSDVTQS